MADNKDTESQDGGLLDRIKESPRTVSALIIILIVAAAIYAFSGDQKIADQTDLNEEKDIPEMSEEQKNNSDIAGTVKDSSNKPANQEQENGKNVQKEMPKPRSTGETYVEVAEAGDGVTHLARRAADRWLTQNNAGYTVTNEHRIYIEDYIKDQLGSKPLSIGEEVNISFELIAEAVKAAGQLNDGQLNNLTTYSNLVFT